AELLTDAATMLVSGGLESTRANELAWNITELIRDRWGGQTLYIPQGLTFETLQRYESIWRAFTGDNVPELARQYDMSKMAVYRALAIMRERDRRARQGDLFGQQQQQQPEAA
ncbi:MAG: hypothetical protein J0M20_18025, partial [Burkholderiales bacterium]|nr:hypothetical protein [Burkholderiales bacterium]